MLKVTDVNATFHPGSVLFFLNSFGQGNRSLLMFLEILSKVLSEGFHANVTDSEASTIFPQIKTMVL